MIAQRIFGWIANELITKKLARSEAFQRWAAHTHEKINNVKPLVRATPPPRRSVNPYRISEYHDPSSELKLPKVDGGQLGTFVRSFAQNIKREVDQTLSKKRS